MKKSLLSIALIIFLAGALTGQPTTITYQGKLLDSSGNAINQAGLVISFSIYDASSGGNMIWPDAGTVDKTVNVVQGLYSVQLGTGDGDDDVFTAAIFSDKSPWLEVKIDAVVMPRTPISNVPFALIANEMVASGWASPGQIGSSVPNSGDFTSLTASGNTTISGDLQVGQLSPPGGGGNAMFLGSLIAGRLQTAESIAIGSTPEDNTVTGLISAVTVDDNTFGIGAALFLASDGNYELARATDLDHMPCVALAVEAGTGLKNILHQGYIRNNSWNWIVGKVIYVSSVDGTLTQTFPTATGSQVQIVGYATHANMIFFNPNLMLIELK